MREADPDNSTRQAHRRVGLRTAFVTIACVLLAGCGGSGTAVTAPAIGPARTFSLANFQPAAAVIAGRPTTVSFTITQPSVRPLTAYRKCCEPHTGVDLIIVRSDDSHILYEDTDIAANGKITQQVVFPTPGRYRIVIDAYPARTSPEAPVSFQLFTWVTVPGRSRPQTVPPYSATDTVDGYQFHIQQRPQLKAIQASFVTVDVRGPQGRSALFAPWRGALAHAIFFREPSLDYFHTHVCAPGATSCTSALGATRVTGTSTTPGKLTVGVLVPEPGTWRMFLLTYINGHHLVAPFTLNVT